MIDTSLRIPSLFQLSERCQLGNVEARLEAVVAAASVTGAAYSIEQWAEAVRDLHQALVGMRADRQQQAVANLRETADVGRALCAAQEAADAVFYSEVDHAIRSWEERLAIPDEDV